MAIKHFDRFHNPVIGYHVLRIFLALMLLMHGIPKLSGGVGHIENMLAGAGLPAFIAFGVYIGEVLAPLMLLAGIYVVPAAAIVVVNMLFAIGLAHSHQILTLNEKTGAWGIELQAFFLVTAVVVAMITPKGRKNLFEKTPQQD